LGEQESEAVYEVGFIAAFSFAQGFPLSFIHALVIKTKKKVIDF